MWGTSMCLPPLDACSVTAENGCSPGMRFQGLPFSMVMHGGWDWSTMGQVCVGHPLLYCLHSDTG
jgi:hypothetical protein